MKDEFGVDFKSAQTIRRAPCAANSRAIARPRPDDEPVTTHTFSSKRVPVLKIGIEEDEDILFSRFYWNFEGYRQLLEMSYDFQRRR